MLLKRNRSSRSIPYRYRSARGRRKRRVIAASTGAAALLLIALALFLVLRSSKRDVEGILNQALSDWDSGDYEAAADQYEKLLRQAPASTASTEARLQLANIYYLKLHRNERAALLYQQFLAQSPSHPNAAVARERLAEVLADLGRSYESIAEYEGLSPQDQAERRRIRLRIADLYYNQNNLSQALTEYAKVSSSDEFDEYSEQACTREASIYHLARAQYAAAVPFYQKLASSSSDPKARRRALYGLADCYTALYKFDEALRVLQEIRDPDQQSYLQKKAGEVEQRRRESVHVPAIRKKG
ncbi:MAG: hypothetical protein DMF61_10715 [Blastocatellia bacterium AA13]|nr:MAG: hypothetical protein DMF61_10715 [Blastocatellia bacterium AA13]